MTNGRCFKNCESPENSACCLRLRAAMGLLQAAGHRSLNAACCWLSLMEQLQRTGAIFLLNARHAMGHFTATVTMHHVLHSKIPAGGPLRFYWHGLRSLHSMLFDRFTSLPYDLFRSALCQAVPRLQTHPTSSMQLGEGNEVVSCHGPHTHTSTTQHRTSHRTCFGRPLLHLHGHQPDAQETVKGKDVALWYPVASLSSPLSSPRRDSGWPLAQVRKAPPRLFSSTSLGRRSQECLNCSQELPRAARMRNSFGNVCQGQETHRGIRHQAGNHRWPPFTLAFCGSLSFRFEVTPKRAPWPRIST